jgi:DNA-directed RNA polymerase specialized sigma subunit
MINEGNMLSYERFKGLMGRASYDNNLANTNQFSRRVEAALYDYPMWKVNSELLQSQYKGNLTLSKDILESPTERLGIRRLDYVSHINLIEATMAVLSPLQQAFVQQRYFRRTPFKIIAEELAVTERHLYRIRQEIIRLFQVSFGWL